MRKALKILGFTLLAIVLLLGAAAAYIAVSGLPHYAPGTVQLTVDVTPERAQAEWYFTSTVLEPSADASLGAMFEVRTGENRLRVAAGAAPPRPGAPPAP